MNTKKPTKPVAKAKDLKPKKDAKGGGVIIHDRKGVQ